MNNEVLNFKEVEERIIVIRGQKVILDSDVATLYGVETKRVNEAVKNNPDKFPEGYILQVSKDEWKGLKSNFSTSMKGGKVKLPSAFTEKGLYMLATILKSLRATETTIAIIETFTKLRELTRTVERMVDDVDEAQQKTLIQKSGELFSDLLDNHLSTTDSETTIELNLAVLKVKHTVKRSTER